MTPTRLRSLATAALMLCAPAASAQLVDLELTKTAAAPTVISGGAIDYTLQLTNLGPDPSLPSTVVDALPPEVSFSSADAACSYDPAFHELTCAAPSLSMGESALFGFSVVADAIPPPPVGGPSAAYVTGGSAGSGEVYTFDPMGAFDPLTGTAAMQSPQGVTRESPTHVLVAEAGEFAPIDGTGAGVDDGAIVRVDRATGALSTLSSGGLLVTPESLRICDGVLYVADRFGLRPDGGGGVDPTATQGRVLAIDPATGSQTIVSEGGMIIDPVSLDCHGDRLLVIDVEGAALLEIDPATGAQSLVSSFGLLAAPAGVAVESATSAIVVDWGGGVVRVDLASGAQTQLVAPAPGDPDFVDPADVAIDRDGTIWVAERSGGGRVLVYDSAGTRLISAGTAPFPAAEAIALVEAIPNRAVVNHGLPDPDPDNQTPLVLTEIEPSSSIDITVVESIVVTQASQLGLSIAIAVQEPIGVGDGPSLLPAALLDVAETIEIGDGEQVLPSLRLTVQETVSVVDVEQLPIPVAVSVQESVTIGDGGVLLPSVVLEVAEFLSLQDTVGLLPSVMLFVGEPVGVGDQTGAAPALLVMIAESISVGDDVAIVVEEGDEPPQVAVLGTVAALTEGALEDGRRTVGSITQIYVTFSEEVADPAGDTDPDDVTNPANYLLVEAGSDGVFDTLDCATGWHPADDRIDIDSALYPVVARTAALELEDGLQLLSGRYQLLTCGTTSIVDLDGNKLDGDGDGQGGDDHRVRFEVVVDNPLANPNFDLGLAGWELSAPGGTSIDGDPLDAGAAPTSGSARLRNLGAPETMALSQCVPAFEDAWYATTSRLQLSTAATAGPIALHGLTWYAQDGCQGQPLGPEDVETVWSGDTGGPWREAVRPWRSPVGARSVLVRFALSAGVDEDFTAHWDDLSVFLDERVVFLDGFESGDTSAWSAVVE